MTRTEKHIDKQLAEDLTGAFTDRESDERLHRRLEDLAEREGLLDVAYRTVDSPIGSLLLAATQKGLVRVAFQCEGHDSVLSRLAAELSPRILRMPRRLDGAARELDEYFSGKRRSFDVEIDLQLVRGFRRSVLVQLSKVPFGSTRTYAALARAAGKPAAVRAAGTACARNPLPLIVPCHRVIRSDGSIGQYLAGAETKRALLAMEAGSASRRRT